MTNSLKHRGPIELAIVVVLAISVARPAQAQTFEVLHAFHKGEGPLFPSGQLVRDSAGNLYGTTALGGRGNCGVYYGPGCGTVFKLSKSGKLLWFYSFERPTGEQPEAGLVRDVAGNLYGITSDGGKRSKACGGRGKYELGCGLVFKLNPLGNTETVRHFFAGGSDGWSPVSLLMQDAAGNLYSTTVWGGGNGCGGIFKIDPNGKETLLYGFKCGTDGGNPYAGVIMDSAGNLYGTTGYGGDTNCGSQEGQGCGTVYKLNSSRTENVLYSLTWQSDGAFPSSRVIQDAAGNLYGTTGLGGNLQVYNCDGYEGCGVAYKLSPNSDGTWTQTTLYEFCSLSNCTDGRAPGGGLVQDAAGNLYGTTSWGGSSPCYENEGCGVVFKLDPEGHETVLHSFTGGADGAYPTAGLVMDDSGNLYGVTDEGGDAKCQVDQHQGCGVVFKITP